MENNKDFSREFSKFEILLIAPHDDDGNNIYSELRHLGAAVKHLWPVPKPLPVEGDVLICEFVPSIPEYIPWLPGDPPLPIILHAPRNTHLEFREIRNCAPHGLLYSPVTEDSIFSTVLLARDRFQYEQRLRSRINKLDDNLRSMRAVEKAKLILMDAKDIDEDEAYRVLRRTAMERRITLGTIATAIVDSYELLR